MKAMPALPTVSTSEVLRIGAASMRQAKEPPRAPIKAATAAAAKDVPSVNHPIFGRIPCASASIAAGVTQFLKR